jgi:hypothetical protein
VTFNYSNAIIAKVLTGDLAGMFEIKVAGCFLVVDKYELTRRA